MSVVVDFYYDLVSPNVYMANKVIPKLAERTGATINYIPFLLGGVMKATNNNPPLVTYAPVQAKIEYIKLEMGRFIKKHRITKFRMNPFFPFNSLMPMRAAVAAQMDGGLHEYMAAGEKLVWEKKVKFDDPETFVEALVAEGIDGAALLERTKDPAVKAKLIENTNAAVERGAFGAPTFFVGGEMFFGKDRLDALEEEIIAVGV